MGVIIVNCNMRSDTKSCKCGNTIFNTYQAKCVNCESTETATTAVSMALNSLTLSLNAMISVGHTNVLKVTIKRGTDLGTGNGFTYMMLCL